MPLLQELPFFAEMANNFRLLSELAQRVEYRCCRAAENVYRLKEPANLFYIILEGTVDLTLPEELEPLQEEQEDDVEGEGEYSLEKKEIFSDFF